MSDNDVVRLMEAITIRNRVARNVESIEWVREQAMEMVRVGYWNDSHIAEIVSFTRQAVSTQARQNKVQRPAVPPRGGRLAASALDGLLELLGSVRREEKPSPSVLRGVISTGTSTRLISRVTGVPIGTVLYQQRVLKKGL